jgi:hypothetical protein
MAVAVESVLSKAPHGKFKVRGYVLEAVAASECFVVWNDDWPLGWALIQRYGLDSALSKSAPVLDAPRKDRSAGEFGPLAE